MIEYTPYRARDQPQNGSASQCRKEKTMHKFEKRDAKSRTLVILAVVGLAAALTVGIFTAVRMIRKPAQSKDDPKNGIVYDDSAIEGGWDNLSPEEIAEKLNEKVAEGMINISMNTAPYFEDGAVFMVLLDFRLRFSEDIFDDGLSCLWIVTNRVPALPASILALSDVPFPVCSSFRHDISLLCNSKPYRKQQRKAIGKPNCYQKVIICA